MTEYQKEQIPVPTPGRLKRELRLRRPPWWMIVFFVVIVVSTWIPLYLIYQERSEFSALPKIHYVQDMDLQPGFRAQQPTNLFADGRAARMPVEGTVARGNLKEDDHFFRGFKAEMIGTTSTVKFFDTLPETMEVNESLIARGQKGYSIYCAVCHDQNGAGNGIVHQRALALKEKKWVPPTNLLTQNSRDLLDGQVFQAISDGVRNMPGYKTQIDPEDRWAIVAFVRQLQSTQPVAIVEPAKPPKE